MDLTWRRVEKFLEHRSARPVYRRPLKLALDQPLISFTFDDFPRSACLVGGAILRQWNLRATYYVSLGLLDKDSASGTICSAEDVRAVAAEGNELGCHTYSHCHSWTTPTAEFVGAIQRNQQALDELIPGLKFQSFSYPISQPRPPTKRAAGKHFLNCRGDGQTMNTGVADLNQLKCFFLEQAKSDINAIQAVLDENRVKRGWLIFATHDIAPDASPYGCTPEFFTEVVRRSVASGARILPVIEGLERIRQCGALA